MRWSLQTSLYMHTIWSSLVTHTGPAASWSSHSWRAYPVPPAWEPPCLPIMVSSFRFAAMPAGLPSLSARQVLSLSLALASLVIFVCIAFVAWVFRFFLRFFLFSFWYLFFFASFACQVGHLRFHDRVFVVGSSLRTFFVSFPFMLLTSGLLLFCLSYLWLVKEFLSSSQRFSIAIRLCFS